MNASTLLFIALAWCTQFAWAFNIPVEDPDLRECIDKLIKKNHWEKIDEVTSIVCHNSGIQSLAGVEQFPNLIKLSLYKNNIISANVSGLHKLESLNIARNNLQSLALKDLPLLEKLYVFGNSIAHVDLSDLPGLTILKASSSEINTFRYKNLTSLKKIYLFDNKMENIDIYNLPSMKYMDVRQNPMPDDLYEEMDKLKGITILHDGNAEDWQ